MTARAACKVTGVSSELINLHNLDEMNIRVRTALSRLQIFLHVLWAWPLA
jgi:hypothetical protein